MRISSTKKILLLLVAVDVLAAAGYVFLLLHVVQQDKITETRTQELAYEIDREVRLRSLDALLEDVSDDRSLIEKQFIVVHEDEIVGYITRIEALSDFTPVALEVISVETESREDEAGSSLNMRVTGVGSREAVIRLLELLETLPTITTIDAAQIHTVSSEDIGERWNITFNLHALMTE